MTNRARYNAIRYQYARGAKGLDLLRDRAIALRRKVNGYTADELARLAAEQRHFSTLDDDALVAHLQGVHARIRTRLTELHAS